MYGDGRKVRKTTLRKLNYMILEELKKPRPNMGEVFNYLEQVKSMLQDFDIDNDRF